MATIDDIVKVSGVSRSTVFRFMNGSNVRADAKKAIIQAMQNLNYKTDEIYKYQDIQIEISISNNFECFQGFTEMVHGITQQADEKGISINIVRRTGNQITNDYEQWKPENRLKGVIVIGKNKEDEQMELEMLKKKNIPHVFLNRVFDDPEISYVAVNLKQAAFDMVTYLIDKGHRKIAVLGNPYKLQADEDKLAGYIHAFQYSDVKVPQECYLPLEDSEKWEEEIRKLLTAQSVPTAYFAICDSYAIKFMHIAEALGLSIPEDISVVGMDDVEMAAYTKPSLTTVQVPFHKMGTVAVDQLIQLIIDEDIGTAKTIIKHKIIERNSCKQQ